MSFWIVTGLSALLSVAVLVVALLRGRAGQQPAAAYDLQVYRDQLKEVDRDLTRKVIEEADAERLRNEISRRILAADAAMKADQALDGKHQVVLHGGEGVQLFDVKSIGLQHIRYHAQLVFADVKILLRRLRQRVHHWQVKRGGLITHSHLVLGIQGVTAEYGNDSRQQTPYRERHKAHWPRYWRGCKAP